MAKAIALYVAKNSRASSPKFILGESYGGFRAAKVARVLQSDQGIVVSGILMLSPVLEGAFQFGGDRFALGAALQLPSLAAAELERKGTFSKDALAQAEHFALTDYLSTLAGPPLQGDAAKTFYARVARNDRIVGRCGGRKRAASFATTMSKISTSGDHKIVSHYDATFASDDPYPETPVARGPDPILDGVIRAYGSAFVGYARDELGFKTDMSYTLLGGRHFRQMGLGARPRPAERRRRSARAAGADAVIPADDRSRLQRHGHALCGCRATCSNTFPLSTARSAPS